MKTNEEIEKLAESIYGKGKVEDYEDGFIDGYTRCQQDMADELKKFEKTIIDLNRKHGYFQGDNLKVLIREFNSLNKQH